MSVGMNWECLQCHLRRHVSNALALGGDETATAFARDLMKMYVSMPEDTAPPQIGPGTNALYEKYFGITGDRYVREKQESNAFVLSRMEDIRRRVKGAKDPLLAGLQYAILGNYIDFSALQGEVSYEKLDEMLTQAEEMELDETAVARLWKEFETGKRLLYLTDNAGEIGFDRIFGEVIHEKFPHLEITFCVRGGPAANDATREDAAVMGIPFPVIDNGTCIAGTVLSELSREAKAAMDRADVILSKGQGNVETLYGCGYNIYYAFLVKCVRFQKLFGKEKLTPMLLPEREQ